MTDGSTYPIRFLSTGFDATLRNFGQLGQVAEVSFGTIERQATSAAASTIQYRQAAQSAANTTNRAAQAFSNFGQTIAVVDGPLGGVASRVTGIGTLLGRLPASAFVATAGLAAFGATMRAAIPVGIEYEKMTLQIEQQIQATGRQAEFSARQINQMAEALDSNTLGDAPEIRRAASELLAFNSITAELTDDVLRLGQDYSAVFGGSMVTATEQIARVLDDPTEGFGRLGRNISGLNDALGDQVQALAESGRMLEAQELILRQVGRAVGGSGEGAAQGLAGIVDSLSQAWRRLLETIGSSDAVQSGTEATLNPLIAALDGIRGAFGGTTTQDEIQSLERQALAYSEAIDSIVNDDDLANYTEDQLPILQRFRNSLAEINEELIKLRAASAPTELPAGIAALQTEVEVEDFLDRLNKSGERARELAGLSGSERAIREAGNEAVVNAQREIRDLSSETLQLIRQKAEANERNSQAAKEEGEEKRRQLEAEQDLRKTLDDRLMLERLELDFGKEARKEAEERLKIERELGRTLRPQELEDLQKANQLKAENAQNAKEEADAKREQLRLEREQTRELERQRQASIRLTSNILNNVFNGNPQAVTRGLQQFSTQSIVNQLFSGPSLSTAVSPLNPNFGLTARGNVSLTGPGNGFNTILGNGFQLQTGVLGSLLGGQGGFLGNALRNYGGISQIAGNLGLGSLIGQIPGLGSTGASVGSVIGGIIPGVGNLVGGLLGGVFGGLFGGKAPPKGGTVVGTDQFGDLDTFGGFSYKDDDGQLRQAAQSLGDAVVGTIGQLADALGADLRSSFQFGSIGVIDGKFTFETTPYFREKYAFDHSQRFDTAEDAVTAAVVSAVQRGVFLGLNEKSQAILASATAETIDRAFEQVEFIETVPEDIARRLQAIEDPLGFALQNIEDEFATLRQQFNELGLDTSDLDRLRTLEREQAISQISATGGAAPFEDFLFSLTGSTQSPLSAFSRSNTATQQFQVLADTLRNGGTVNAGDFQQLANARLAAASDRFGQGSQFFDVFNDVTALTELAIERERSEVERQIEAADRITEAVDAQTDQMIEQQQVTNDRLQEIRDALAQAGLSGGFGSGLIPNFSGFIPQ
ncbi:MAG: phage tail length tape measure family protein [Pseudomonadota bacterium]